MKGELHLSVAFFNIGKEDSSAIAIASPRSLNAPAAIDDGLIVPLDL
jgi:hypothetical protein